ncbi:MAG: SdpI family protein [Candidatus Fimivivens sp.]
MSNRKLQRTDTAASMTREMQIAAANMFGKHMSRQKRIILLLVTLLCCAMPMIMGIRFWHDIPALVPSGLIGMDGKDDSLPRWVVALGLPGLMCLLNAIAHAQLWRHQNRMTLPPSHIRLTGRWGFPVISVIFCSGMIRQSLGHPPLPLVFLTPCIIGLLLLIFGGQMWACPQDAKVALRFSFATRSAQTWNAVHRTAGSAWMAAGLLTLLNVMLPTGLTPFIAVLVVVAIAAPFVYGLMRRDN